MAARKRLTIRTPTPGFEASIWVADEGVPQTAPPEGWTRVSSEAVDVGASEPIDLDTAGNRYRRYLVWITKLPPEKQVGRDLRDPAVPVIATALVALAAALPLAGTTVHVDAGHNGANGAPVADQPPGAGRDRRLPQGLRHDRHRRPTTAGSPRRASRSTSRGACSAASSGSARAS